ncbi:MAG TPA: hypothetical protein VEH31_07865 [Streptosporangiaceae bacterium]|nr:hypothetical protein [Streptosporangiaceae bacterium]
MSQQEYEEWRYANTWHPSRDSKLILESDVAPATWIEPSLFGDWCEVRMTVPQGFEAYARIFFPFVGEAIIVDGLPGNEHITWTEMARRNGRIAHALMEAQTIQASADECASCYDELVPEQFEVLLPILTRHTSSSRSWFLLWEGFGDLPEQAFRPLPMVRHPMRDFYLLSGPHSAYKALPHDPGYWWPDDRAWCVCTDTDFNWAYVAGSAACIDEVLSVPALDAYATKPENPAHAGMDVINDPDGAIPRPI